jgi:Na+/H+ antiporter NhaC
METAKSLYSNVLALMAVVLAALIFAGMPVFYGLDTTVDVAVVIGLFSGTVLTLSTKLLQERNRKKPARLVRAKAV